MREIRKTPFQKARGVGLSLDGAPSLVNSAEINLVPRGFAGSSPGDHAYIHCTVLDFGELLLGARPGRGEVPPQNLFYPAPFDT